MSGLHDFVFDCMQDLQSLEKHIASSPQLVYAVARAFEERFRENDLTAASFTDFTDKEYVQQVQTKMGEVIQESHSKLSPDQISHAQACLDAITQMPLLDQAIKSKSAREQGQATEPEWKKLERQVSIGKTCQILGALGLVAFIFCCLPAAFLVIIATANRVPFGIWGLWLVLSLGCLASSIALMSIGFIASASPRHKQLQKARQGWKRKLLPHETKKQVVALFGNQSSQDYISIRADRENLIHTILGQVEGTDWLAAINRSVVIVEPSFDYDYDDEPRDYQQEMQEAHAQFPDLDHRGRPIDDDDDW